MPLSLSKLQEFLINQDFKPINYFSLNGEYRYIEVFSDKIANSLFIYISSKYKFNDETASYKLKSIDIEDTGTAEDYIDDNSVSKKYTHTKININSENVQDTLENNYKHSIDLKDMASDDLLALKTGYRQIKRLRYCVETLNYKIGIISKGYLISIKRNDIECFLIKKYPRDSSKKFFVVIDLENFYKNIDNIHRDIAVVKQSIYTILEKNQEIHIDLIDQIIKNKKYISIVPEKVSNKKAEYEKMISELYTMLKTLNTKEDSIKIDMKKSGAIDIYSDIERAHKRKQMEKELEKVLELKRNVIVSIIENNKKLQDLILTTDELLFDNAMMIDKVLENFRKLNN